MKSFPCTRAFSPSGLSSRLVIAIATVTLASCAGYVPGRQAYWDAKVKEMCEKDGGVTVYERVYISGNEYQQLTGGHGSVPVPDERSSNKNTPYFSRLFTREINAVNPKVTRSETEIVRRVDNKVLGKVVIYSRVGGDLPTGIGHDTYSSCEDIPQLKLDVEKQVFVVTGETK